MQLRFTKMHVLGNDFVVLDLITQPVQLDPHLIRFLANRHRGIGCDRIVTVEPPGTPEMDFRLRSYNPDGSEAPHCGNAASCIARFIRDHRLSAKRQLHVETARGAVSLTTGKGNLVTVAMGVPVIEPQEIPFRAAQRAASYTLEVGDAAWQVSVVSVGDTHAVVVVDDVETAPVAALGQAMATHPDFPDPVSTGFMQVLNRNEIRLRMFEYGVGETGSSGNCACAAVVAGRLRGMLGERVRVNLPGGYLHIEWRSAGDTLLMTEPATMVFEGQITL